MPFIVEKTHIIIQVICHLSYKQLLELLRAITSYKCLLRVPKLSAIISGGGGFALGRSLLRRWRRGFGQDRAGLHGVWKPWSRRGFFGRWWVNLLKVKPWSPDCWDFTWRCWVFFAILDLFPCQVHMNLNIPHPCYQIVAVHQVAIQNGWLVLIRDQRWGNWY